MLNGTDDPFAANLIGLWDFLDTGPANDTGLADGIAQNGALKGNALVAGGQLHTDGSGDYFEVDGDDEVAGNDAPFDLAQGTIAVQFSQDCHVGSSPDTLVSRGEYCDRATEGFFEIRVTGDGRVEVMHCANGQDVILKTDAGFFCPGDNVKATYTWSETEGGTFLVENLTAGTTQSIDYDTLGLTMDIGDNDDESFTFGAREVDDGCYDRFFNGAIDYVAVYDLDIVNVVAPPPPLSDGIVSGTSGDDLIDLAYTGDPEGDRIDAGDAILPGEAADDDIVHAGDGDDTVHSGLGDDTVYGGDGNDTVYGGTGNDQIHGQDGTDILFGEAGNDVIHGGDGHDAISGGGGDDVLAGGDGYDAIHGGGGNDRISGGKGRDLIFGGAGQDTITGGARADFLFGGADQDTFLGGTDGDRVNGGEGTSSGNPADDYDTLDLTGAAQANNPGGSLVIDYDSNPENGTVRFLDAGGVQTGSMQFKNIEHVVPCFTPGTLIATPKGERRIESLQVGDRIITRDNGIQEIQWLGHRGMLGTELRRNPHLRPVLISAGALGNGLPERDMMVSPNHRVLVSNDKTALYFEESEVLVAAKHLTGLKGVGVTDVSHTTYIHLMFTQHEIILSDGAWTESFQPGMQALEGVGNAQRTEIMELFPELNTQKGIDSYMSARRSLKKHEARVLTK